MRWMHAGQLVAILLAVTGVAFLAAGCSEPSSGEYLEYSQLDGDDASNDGDAEISVEAAKPPVETETAQADADEDAGPASDSADTGNAGAASIDDPLPERETENLAETPEANSRPDAVTTAGSAATIAPLAEDPTVRTTPGVVGAAAEIQPREVKVLVKDRDFKVEGPQDALRVSYDDLDLLKVLNMEPVTADAPNLMPKWLKDLDGRRIRIRGFMFPPYQETGLENFVLARDNQICCFGRYPKIYDVFAVKMREGETTDYIQNRPFDVVGVFHIAPIAEDGKLHQLYRIDDAIVIE